VKAAIEFMRGPCGQRAISSLWAGKGLDFMRPAPHQRIARTYRSGFLRPSPMPMLAEDWAKSDSTYTQAVQKLPGPHKILTVL